MILGSATLHVTNRFDYAYAFDGVVPSLEMNLNFNGAMFTSWDDRPARLGNQWASYSFPPFMDMQEPRIFPAAMWVDADNVCQAA